MEETATATYSRKEASSLRIGVTAIMLGSSEREQCIIITSLAIYLRNNLTFRKNNALGKCKNNGIYYTVHTDTSVYNINIQIL